MDRGLGDIYIYIYIQTHGWVSNSMDGSLILRVGLQNRGGVKKSKRGQKVRKHVQKWKKVKKSEKVSKRGSDFGFWGGGQKTHPLKVDRIYGESFCVVTTGEVFLEVTFGVKKQEIWSFLSLFPSFSSFWDFRRKWPGVPHEKTRPPKNDPDDQKGPPKSDPGFEGKTRWKVTEIWGGKSDRDLGG